MSNTPSAFSDKDLEPYKSPYKIYQHSSKKPKVVAKQAVKAKPRVAGVDKIANAIKDVTERKRKFSVFTPLSK